MLLSSSVAYAGFEFCPENSNGEGGNGTFQQSVQLAEIIEVGELPAGISGVEINLSSIVDIDIQLYDKATGEKIIHWPNGILAGGGYQSIDYHDNLIEWSGFNGDGSGLGNEYIKITGSDGLSTPTNRSFIMKVFGYESGSADVVYSWNGANCDVSGSGNGSFQQQIVQNAIVVVGEIPEDVINLNIDLTSDQDVDIQLFDAENGRAIVAWPNGILSGDKTQSINYQGMIIEWSGYNGNGVQPGIEYISISGATTKKLIMKAFGYRSGLATVDYSWGGDNGPGGNTGGTEPTGGTGSAAEETIKNQLMDAINAARSQGRNCGSIFYAATTPLTWNTKLYQAALAHTQDMVNNNFFSHTGFDGQNAGFRISTAGYAWSTYGENIAAGYETVQSVMTQWLSSPLHCGNIMNPYVTNVGLAKVVANDLYGEYWTQVFARPQ